MTFESKFERISDQVVEYLFEPFNIRQDPLRHIIRYFNYQLEAFLLDLKLHNVANFICSLSNVKLFVVERELVILNSADLKAVFYHILKVQC